MALLEVLSGSEESVHARAEEFVRDYFRRHPKVKRYFRGVRVVPVEKAGTGSHPEARYFVRGKIELYPKFWRLSRDLRDFVFTHEIGHHVLSTSNKRLVEEAKDLGVDVWDNLPFGQFNMEEAFADSFASYFLDGDVRKRYPQWAALVERYL